eukprot:TRINITY_DN1095_c10_g1_i1.p1 TRINITY_DN1095_c10_g1~~TRINITY_DN1095_c10_g1_i1.p1  ORF type:complete len:468 (+),score=99.08 TRINITY_DN1095_c10_g1_i1:91-1494(+)
MLASAVALAAVAGPRPVPIPPVFSAVQAETVAKAAAVAAPASAAAHPTLLGFLGSEPFKRHMSVYSAELTALQPEELWSWYREGVRVAEIMHNIRTKYPKGNWDANDDSLDTVLGYPYLFNIWQLQALGFRNQSEQPGIEAQSEVHVMGFPPFKKPGKPTFDEASSRIVYGAVNTNRIDAGNPTFGDLGFALNTTAVRGHELTSAVDTGLYTIDCTNMTEGEADVVRTRLGWAPGPPLNCSAWTPPVMATLDHYDHAFLSNVWFWNTTTAVQAAGAEYAYYNAAKHIARALLRYSHPEYPWLSKEEVAPGNYFETDPAMTIMFPEGVSHLITAASLIGTPQGDAIRNWSVANDWPLFWAASCDANVTTWPVFAGGLWNSRILDPHVAARTSVGKNLTSPAFESATAAFASVWSECPKCDAWKKWGSLLTALGSDSVLSVEPLFPGACSDTARCVAVQTATDGCVCKH